MRRLDGGSLEAWGAGWKPATCRTVGHIDGMGGDGVAYDGGPGLVHDLTLGT